MDSDTNFDQSSLALDFNNIQPQVDRFTKQINGVIVELLKINGIDVVATDPRTKSLESFKGKLERPGKEGKYKSCFDMTDISGVRIIVYLQEDVVKVVELIRRHFDIDEANSYDIKNDDNPDRFGYRSSHLIASYNASRLALPEFGSFAGFKAEIQVRTVLQHAWAQIDWKLRYKNVIEIPKGILRPLYILSALLESADKEFSRIAGAVQLLEKEYQSKINRGNFKIPIDAQSLAIYVRTSETVKILLESFKRHGFVIASDSLMRTPAMTSQIIEFSRMKNFSSIEDLDVYISGKRPEFEKAAQKFSSLFSSRYSLSKMGFVPDSIVILFLLGQLDRNEIASVFGKSGESSVVRGILNRFTEMKGSN